MMQKAVQFLFAVAVVFAATQSKAAVLISVQDAKNDAEWSSKACQNMFNSVNLYINEPVTCFVTPGQTFQDARVKSLQESGKFHTHIRVFRGDDNKIVINTYQWITDDDTDFKLAPAFHINKSTGDEQIYYLSMYARKWANYRKYRNDFKADILASVVGESKEIKFNENGDLVDTQTLEPVTYHKAYDRFSSESSRHHKILTTALEVTAALGFGVYNYYKDVNSNKVDWDYPQFWKGLGLKLTGKAIKEDDNPTVANINHVFAGQVYYQIARNNGLNFGEAALASVASASAWEFSEFREVFSINDIIVTGWGGSILGETMFQMARAVRNKSDSIPAKLLATLFDPFATLNEIYDRLTGDKSRHVKESDLDMDQFAKFDFIALTGRSRFANGSSTEYKGAELKGEVINIPDWDQPGKNRQILMQTPVAQLDLLFTKNKFSTEDLKFVANVILSGMYQKNRTETDGYEYLVGLSSGFDWEQKKAAGFKFEEVNDANKDMWARVHVIGGTLKAIGLYKGVKFNMEMRLSADYVLVSAYALQQLEQAEGGRAGLMSVVQKNGYYYGTGFSEQLRAGLSYSGWEAGWEIKNDNVQNSNYPQRFDDRMTKDYRFKDQRTENSIFVRKVLNKSFAVQVSVARVDRSGTIAHKYQNGSIERKTEVRLDYIW